jgi:hypothetical protein
MSIRHWDSLSFNQGILPAKTYNMTSKSQLLYQGRTHSGYRVWRTANIIALLLLLAATAFGQNAVRSDDGNFQSAAKVKAMADSTTTYTYTDAKGEVFPVYVGGKGAFYVGRTSKKTGKYYRFYLKTENSEQ